MSDILIKNKEMPKSCEECNLESFCSLWVDARRQFGDGKRTSVRHPDCPLIEVPKHGRLVDADALMKILSKVVDVNASIEQRNEAVDQEMRCLWWFEQQIGIAPTIIESEE